VQRRISQPNETILTTEETGSKQTDGMSTDNQGALRRREAEMNHSIHSADRATHLKIVVVALLAGMTVTAFGIATRSSNSDTTQTAARVIKAGKPVVVTSSDSSMVR
jgi:hypothetical protein